MTEAGPGTVGTSDTRLIVLRGKSASGKSSGAAGLREKFGRNLAIGAQDNLRRIVPCERDQPGGANIVLIDLTARYALAYGFHASWRASHSMRARSSLVTPCCQCPLEDWCDGFEAPEFSRS